MIARASPVISDSRYDANTQISSSSKDCILLLHETADGQLASDLVISPVTKIILPLIFSQNLLYFHTQMLGTIIFTTLLLHKPTIDIIYISTNHLSRYENCWVPRLIAQKILKQCHIGYEKKHCPQKNYHLFSLKIANSNFAASL